MCRQRNRSLVTSTHWCRSISVRCRAYISVPFGSDSDNSRSEDSSDLSPVRICNPYHAGNLMAPPKLARDTPGLNVFEPIEIGFFPILRNEARLARADSRERWLRQGLRVNIPLFGEPRLDDRARTVAMRHHVRSEARPFRGARAYPSSRLRAPRAVKAVETQFDRVNVPCSVQARRRTRNPSRNDVALNHADCYIRLRVKHIDQA